MSRQLCRASTALLKGLKERSLTILPKFPMSSAASCTAVVFPAISSTCVTWKIAHPVAHSKRTCVGADMMMAVEFPARGMDDIGWYEVRSGGDGRASCEKNCSTPAPRVFCGGVKGRRRRRRPGEQRQSCSSARLGAAMGLSGQECIKARQGDEPHRRRSRH